MLTRTLILIAALYGGFPAAAAQDAPARGMSFEVFIRLEHGMTEGELVLRAGRPDHFSVDNYREGLKSYYYFPTLANPFLTTVLLRSGRIVSIDRVRKS